MFRVSIFLLLVFLSTCLAFEKTSLSGLFSKLELKDNSAKPTSAVLEEMLRHIEADKRNKRTREQNGDILRSEFEERRDFINGDDTLRTVREPRVGQRGRTR